MKYLVTMFLLSVCQLGLAETPILTADESIPIPKVAFDAKDDLVISASATSSPTDFDFLVGKWKMHNRHLNKRLENCKEWTEFDSSDENTKILGGNADMDTYSTTQFPGQQGIVSLTPSHAEANSCSRQWHHLVQTHPRPP